MVFHTKIVDAINPYAEKLRNLPGGWAIPIALLVIFSFPPLIGGEFIDILVGVVWGVWKGFLIASAGHLLGEIANWFVFKYWCTGRSEKYEAHKLGYACLARVVREGGFWAVLIIRYSAIPNHLTTVMFSVVGIKFWVYLLANILSLPNLFLTVYLGVIADEKNESKGSKILSYVVTGVAIIVTIAAGRWTFHRMDAVRPGIVEERKIARAARRAGLEKRMGAGAQSQRNRAYPGGNNSPDDSPTSAPLLLPRTSDN
ncbi:hypothetical protein DL93DRAFT_2086792 [Clavulina sp. PMI_390]|nr:hypothetical protein DL93DRAFT_2086792 [Clavulina sp. PMI_390]